MTTVNKLYSHVHVPFTIRPSIASSFNHKTSHSNQSQFCLTLPNQEPPPTSQTPPITATNSPHAKKISPNHSAGKQNMEDSGPQRSGLNTLIYIIYKLEKAIKKETKKSCIQILYFIRLVPSQKSKKNKRMA